MAWAGRAKRKSKYNNVKVVVDGEEYDSEREYKRCCELRLLERAGVIKNLRRQVEFVIAPSVKLHGRQHCARKYIADFVYTDERGNEVVEDCKGHRTEMYLFKRHLMMAVHGIEIRET
jgi:hypothetical protein